MSQTSWFTPVTSKNPKWTIPFDDTPPRNLGVIGFLNLAICELGNLLKKAIERRPKCGEKTTNTRFLGGYSCLSPMSLIRVRFILHHHQFGHFTVNKRGLTRKAGQGATSKEGGEQIQTNRQERGQRPGGGNEMGKGEVATFQNTVASPFTNCLLNVHHWPSSCPRTCQPLYT